ncbi:MAG: formate transporter FocA [Chloroflexota bacterium]
MATAVTHEQPGIVLNVDALVPQEMARRAEDVGVRKARLPTVQAFVLAILAGAFISLGAAFSTTVASGASNLLPYGVVRLLAGVSFSLGLVLVVVGGAELFTGNTLIVMAWAAGRLPLADMLRNWVVVYAGNLVGALGVAVLVFLSGQYAFGGGAVGLTALSIANTKAALYWPEATALGVLCNLLVCLAVWMSLSARSTTDRILAVVPPITAFVAMGFEHSVANMYFIPLGILIRNLAPAGFWQSISRQPTDFGAVDWGGFVANLAPVTLGNVIGGAVLVATVYWFVYLRGSEASELSGPVERGRDGQQP